ncbi:MAG TPA: PEP/pyruvate-binding domain-containing protein [Herpetosiphonaceae bacterium]|nr:PEP/pyruvate-binding domain-containing protein [Herpetosiphonaceae bacterium]
MLPFVVSLDDAQAAEAPLVGLRAARLARLRQAGLPVPDGFVVTAEVFRTAPHGEITPDVEAAIAAAYAGLGAGAVAVRPSTVTPAGGEVGGFASFHPLAGLGKLVRQIERCWQSATGPEARAACAGQGVEVDQVALAVLVQALAPAAPAGAPADPGGQLAARAEAALGGPHRLEWAAGAPWIIDARPE